MAAPTSMLVNVSRLVTAYYAEHPDPSVAAERVAFGTSGHRGSAFDRTFNKAHILAITQAICSYRRAHEIEGPLFMGMDHHALSEPAFARLLSGRRPAVHVRVAGAGHEGAVGCVQQDKSNYDRHIRAELMLQTICTLQDAGVEPDVWKIEGLDRREDCERVVETARRGGRDDVGCVVLGRGADEKKVVSWLETAASVPGFIGFAVGRRTFWEAVAAYEAHTSTRREASARVAQRFREWPTIFERARSVISRN